MPTGACGIQCDVCRLNLRGICSTCGAGTSSEAERKLEAQNRLLGAPCPILECARLNRVDYCLRDCSQFPCDNFSRGPYPFSQEYLNMQNRRRTESLPATSPSGLSVTVQDEHWEDLAAMSMDAMARAASADLEPPDALILSVLGEPIRLDTRRRRIEHRVKNAWQQMDDSLLCLVLVVYLLNAWPTGLSGDRVSVKDLKSAHFFQGPHTLRTDHLVTRFGCAPEAFLEAAARYGGQSIDAGADAAVRLMALPKIPLYYLLWVEDEEFSASISILFDRSIEDHLQADAIWGLVNMVSDRLIMA